MRIIIVLVICSIISSCCTNRIKKKLALDYLFCTQCSINEAKFKCLKDEDIIEHYQGNKLTQEEFTMVVNYASYQYDHYFKPFIDKTTLPFFNSIKNTKKEDYVKQKIAVYKNYRKEKVELWDLNINNDIILKGNALFYKHADMHNDTLDDEFNLSDIEIIKKGGKVKRFFYVRIKNKKGFVHDKDILIDKDEYEFLVSEKEKKRNYLLQYKSEKINGRKFKILKRRKE